MTEKRFTKVEHIFGLNDEGIKDNQTKIEYYYALDLIDLLNELSEENEQLKKKILEEIDLEVAYVNETYSDGRMSEEQNNGAIISLRQLREKFE